MVLGTGALVQPLFGCDRSAPPNPEVARAEAEPANPGSPLLSADPPPEGETEFEGVVEQVLPAGGYTYLAVTLPDGSRRWVATMGDGEPLGAHVHVRSMAVKRDFRSRRLTRTFDHLVFGIVSTT